MKNIISGFKVTGVCPFDRNAIVVPDVEEPSLPESSGLAYIPFHSPARLSHPGPKTLPCAQSPLESSFASGKE